MAKNLIFGPLDHSITHFWDVWMILHDLVTLPNVKTHFVLSQYAISSRSNNANSRKWRKTSFLALWIIQKCISVMFEWSFMTWKHCRMLKTFSTITICNIKSIQQTKLRIMAKNLFFGTLDHSKMHFRDVWMILHDLVTLPNVKNI